MAYFTLAVLTAFLWICVYVFRNCFFSPKNRREDPYTRAMGDQYEPVADIISECIRIMDETPCKWVTTTSFDGLQLWGRFYPTDENAPTMIVFHGYRGNALRDGAASFVIANRLGWNVLIPDQRGHARSDGRVITFGVKERLDVDRWVQFVGLEQPIVLSGLSMGAATVLMASNLDLQENVAGIIADCPYDSPAGIIQKVCTDRHFHARLVYPFIRWTARVFCGFDLESASAIDAVKGAKIPILLLHGKEDRFVPWQMSQNIAKACASTAELEIFPKAGHGLCYMTDPARYEKAVLQFLWRSSVLRDHLKRSSFGQMYR